jgi:hypothetical protein
MKNEQEKRTTPSAIAHKLREALSFLALLAEHHKNCRWTDEYIKKMDRDEAASHFPSEYEVVLH